METRAVSYCYRVLLTTVSLALLSACGGNGTVNIPPPTPDAPAPGFTIGSANVASADPTIPRPAVTPCTVTLFSNSTFNGFSSQNFTYNPPANCSGPYAKIVLEADFSVSAGRQFDRTAHISLAGVNLYTGTTQEPSASVAPSWHVERDLSEYAGLFATAQSGAVDLDNLVDATYTGIPTGSARLVFYPASTQVSAASAANAIYAFSSGANGRPVILNTSASTLSQTYTFPTNVVRAYLEIIAQGQSNDEFWYTCAPDALANSLQTCGSTAFRETQITIDGTPAGVAPIFPWIFTGGIDPGLWRNIPGVQTLNMQPYRVDLSPFSAVLNDGKPHTIALSVQNADSYFAATGALLIYTDPTLATVTGGITSNSLVAAVAPTVNNQLSFDSSGNPSGSLSTTSARQFQIVGTINSSHGQEILSVNQNMQFSNVQTYTATTQQFVQNTYVNTISSTTIGNAQTVLARESNYPLNLGFNIDSNGNWASTVAAAIKIKANFFNNTGNGYSSLLNNSISNASYAPSAPAPAVRSANQRYVFIDTQGSCYDRSLSSTNLLLTSAIDAGSCGGAGSISRMPWFVDPLGGTGFLAPLGY